MLVSCQPKSPTTTAIESAALARGLQDEFVTIGSSFTPFSIPRALLLAQRARVHNDVDYRLTFENMNALPGSSGEKITLF